MASTQLPGSRRYCTSFLAFPGEMQTRSFSTSLFPILSRLSKFGCFLFICFRFLRWGRLFVWPSPPPFAVARRGEVRKKKND